MTDLPSRINPQIARHMAIFQPYAVKRLVKLEKNKTRFVYYTSADTGLKILSTRNIWMRQASCMNDYSEVQHGLDCLAKAWQGEHGKRLREFLEKHFPGIVREITNSFDAFQDALRYDTYMTCLSEHAGPESEAEDLHGRLSMWRAYGRGVGVALVIKQDPFWTSDMSLGLFSTPVAYLSDEGFAKEFCEVVDNIEANADYIDKIGRDWVRHSLVMAFSTAAVSTKHPGFHEEREWRIVRTPNFPFPCPLEKVTITIDGVPQSVLLLELKDRPPDLLGVEPAALLDRVIIGPTSFPIPIRNAYLERMKAEGIADAESKLSISFLPLRG